MNSKLLIPAFIFILIGVIGMSTTAKDYFSHNESIDGEQTFQPADIQSLYIDSNVANVHIHPSPTDEIKVVWEGKRFGLNEPEVDVYVVEDQLNIHLGNKSFFNLTFFQFDFNFNRFNLDVYLPEKHFQSMDVNSNVGAITIDSVNAGDLIVHSEVANITLENISATTIDVTSSVGEISLKDIEAKIQASTDVGDIHVQANEIHGDMTLQSNVGDIAVKVPEIMQNISFNGSSNIGSVHIFGSNKIHVSDQADYVVYMETDVGDIDVVSD